MAMKIDPQTGMIRLPSGFDVSVDLTQDAFRALPVFGQSETHSHGTPPWIHYTLSGGQLDSYDVLVSLCFYDQMLVDASMTVDLYPPGPKDWSRYSLDVEADMKNYHDDLLTRMFGKPSHVYDLPNNGLPPRQQTLARTLHWNFPWGCAFSCHDFRGGGTFIFVRYGDRKEQAERAYARKSPTR